MRSSVPWSTCAGRFSLLDIQVDCNWIIVDRFHLFVKWYSVLWYSVLWYSVLTKVLAVQNMVRGLRAVCCRPCLWLFARESRTRLLHIDYAVVDPIGLHINALDMVEAALQKC